MNEIIIHSFNDLYDATYFIETSLSEDQVLGRHDIVKVEIIPLNNGRFRVGLEKNGA